MKKRSREINIFSMSALDLFASAMGAFILITIVLFPFFPNMGDSSESITEERARLEQERAKLQQERAKLEQEKSQVPPQSSPLEERVKALEQEIDDTSVLLGIKTTAKKFVIVVDMSGSIYQPGGQDYRQFITLSVRDMLSSFQSEIELVMVGFHAPNRRTQLHYWPENRRYFQVMRSTREQVLAAIDRWMNRVDGGTPTREALLAALALSPEEIILLSDGAPNEDWRSVVNAVTRGNIKRTPIHAVAVGNYVAQRDFVEFLIALTKRNGGVLVGAKPG